MGRKNKIDEWRFSGAGAFTASIDNAAAVDLSANFPDLTLKHGGVVRIPATAHAWLASASVFGPSKNFLLTYIHGSVNYDGLRVVKAVATDTIDILAPYVAETFAGTETIQPGFKFDHDVEIIGFDLHLGGASATEENISIIKDADAGAAFDATIYSSDMNSVIDSSINFEELATTQRFINAQDRVYFTWANTNEETWGLTIRTCRKDG